MIIYGLISRGAEHPLNCKFWGLCTSENEAKGGLCEMSLVASVQFSLDKYPHWHWSKNGKMSLRTVFKVFFFLFCRHGNESVFSFSPGKLCDIIY